jgi:hypothetical protein
MTTNQAPAKPRHSITVTFRLQSLGDLPEHHLPANSTAVERYFDEDGANLPLAEQLNLIGRQAATKMVTDEIRSWMGNLSADPQDIFVTCTHAPARYSHLFGFGFSVEATDPTGEDIPAPVLRQQLMARLAQLDDDELLEAVGLPSDSAKIS